MVFVAFCAVSAYAVPANPNPITIKQPDGRTLTLILQGDEHLHWAKTLDNYTLLRNSEGYWSYAVMDDDNNMVASQFLAVNADERTAAESNFVATLQPDLRYSKEQVRQFKSKSVQYAPSPNESKYPTLGTVKLLVVLVQYQDFTFTYTNANFQSLVADSNYNGTGSVRDYYRDNSNGKFTMDIDVAGPYTIPYNKDHFGGSSNMYDFYTSALAAADADVDFSDYDNDGDGKLDAVHFIFAGTPQSSTQNPDEIWPHRSSLWGMNVTYDGIQFNGQPYSCSAEKRNSSTMDGIGTICHEFGHVLNFPDLYDTDYEGTGGTAIHPNTWDLMASGSYNNSGTTPAGLNAYEKQIAGWLTPVELTYAQDSIVLPILDTLAYKINLANNEFFIIEHRKQTKWDTYIPASGMVIWHGDMDNLNAWFNNRTNKVNCNPNDRGWFIEPANGVYAQQESPSASFPGTLGITAYTDDSSPASKLKNGTPTNKPITDIQYINDSTIIFNFMSNKPAVQTTGLKSSSATGTTGIVIGKVVYYGSGNLTSTGFYYSTDTNVNETSSFAAGTLSNDSIIATLTSLTPSTTIYYRAYAANIDGYSLGARMQFNTLSGCGVVSTNPAVAASITDTSVTLGGNLISEGDFPTTQLGVVYTDGTINPTIENANVAVATTTSLGNYTVTINGLTPGKRYYFKAFVTNQAGTSYGSKLSFTTTGTSDLANVDKEAAELNVFPNPSNGVFTITSNITEKANVIIVNSIGQIMYRKSDCDLRKFDLNVTNLDNGIYFVSITTADTTIKRRIVINK